MKEHLTTNIIIIGYIIISFIILRISVLYKKTGDPNKRKNYLMQTILLNVVIIIIIFIGFYTNNNILYHILFIILAAISISVLFIIIQTLRIKYEYNYFVQFERHLSNYQIIIITSIVVIVFGPSFLYISSALCGPIPNFSR